MAQRMGGEDEDFENYAGMDAQGNFYMSGLDYSSILILMDESDLSLGWRWRYLPCKDRLGWSDSVGKKPGQFRST